MKHDYQKEFRDFLKKSRENVGLTQQKAADRIKISIQGFQKWESGESLPSPAYYSAIIETYNLDRKIFLEKLNNAQCPPPEIEEKERKYPWPDFMPLEKWMGTSTLENLKNLQLNELETELLGLEEIYHFNGTINLDTSDLINSINNSLSKNKYNMVGNLNLSGIPYDFIKSYGAFNIKNAKRKLENIFHNNRLKSLVLEYFSKNPNNKTFDICDLTEKEFYDYSLYVDAFCQKGKTSLGNIIFHAIEILEKIERYNNKYCLFDGIEITELSEKKGVKHLFTDESLYTLFISKNQDGVHWCKNMYVQAVGLFDDFIEMKEELITDNLEYLEYQNKLKFYEENKDKGAIKPEEPKTITGLYVVPTEKGKELLKWYRETIKNQGGDI